MIKKKTILTAVLLGMLVGGVGGYVMLSKAPVKVEDVKSVNIPISQLADDYAADEAKANEKYLNKAIVVSGTVTDVQTNQDGKALVILDDKVQCTMRDNATIATGSTITVKGFCTGNSLFGVLLSDGVIVE